RAAQPPDIRAIFDQFLAWLAASGLAAGSLRPGATLPDFLLPNAEGRLVSSAELLARGPLVLSFFRGDWCPYCNLALAALERALPAI
ncbi:redoxin domain-containing protein, partial [Acinetobacter baumannii]